MRPIEDFIRKWAAGATPFVWLKTADEILPRPSANQRRLRLRDTSRNESHAARQRGSSRRMPDAALQPTLRLQRPL